ncbi:RNA polymerase sporulation sigma factor SigF [Alkalibaculum sp. M08DMB]|uniref:RNA polymerase sigma factor n=1 Tax=Alkalibaculum sporogenes TaxID=2655001 RepID=A0A6A7KAE3_9FIRM|nr:RNA polymerase sporulation sigma factor SigF [Alkalibaculum sporogenes]MPW26332.1 RNA polymerase sporulation sigma factor SigF [Alkalibaculum sporogenes]
MISEGYSYNDHEQTIELIIKAQGGDKLAKEVLITSNIGLVNSIVNKFSNRGHDREDLFQIGSIGLIKAVDNFNTSFDVKFSTYAVPMIMGEIKRFLRDDGLIKVNRNLKSIYKKVYYIKENFFNLNNREPTIEEIAKEIGVEKEEIVMALEACYAPDYLYEVIHHDDGNPVMLIDKIGSDEKHEENFLDKITLKEIISRLPPRERQIVVMRYFQDKTQNEIAENLNISQVQVSRIEKKILIKLKEYLSG